MKSLSVAIQMEAAELYFPMVLFIMLLYNVVLTFIAGLFLVLSLWKEVCVPVFTLPSFTEGISIYHFSFDLFLKHKISLIKSLS